MEPLGLPFPAPLEKPLPTNVETIKVEPILYELDRFLARITDRTVELASLEDRQVCFNAVLNGGHDRKLYVETSWAAFMGLKYWVECCSGIPLEFLKQITQFAKYNTAFKDLLNRVKITRDQLKTLIAWAGNALSVFTAFKKHFPDHLARHLEWSPKPFATLKAAQMGILLLKGKSKTPCFEE